VDYVPSMLRLLRSLRRSGALLFGALLVHTTWLASTGVCDTMAAGIASVAGQYDGAKTSAPHHAHQHQHVPGSSGGSSARADLLADATTGAPHEVPTVACPMAMACAVSAIVASVPTIASQTVVAPASPSHAAQSMPLSARRAPEPPPPRG
jgi:hypothetical protein